MFYSFALVGVCLFVQVYKYALVGLNRHILTIKLHLLAHVHSVQTCMCFLDHSLSHMFVSYGCVGGYSITTIGHL